jgi:hypothetical protein
MTVESDVLIHFHFNNAEGGISRSDTLYVRDQTSHIIEVPASNFCSVWCGIDQDISILNQSKRVE